MATPSLGGARPKGTLTDGDDYCQTAFAQRHGSPAFDLVPNPDEHPSALSMQLSTGRFDISRASVLGDAHRFGFASRDDSAQHLDELIDKIADSFNQIDVPLPESLTTPLHARLAHNRALLLQDKPAG